MARNKKIPVREKLPNWCIEIEKRSYMESDGCWDGIQRLFGWVGGSSICCYSPCCSLVCFLPLHHQYRFVWNWMWWLFMLFVDASGQETRASRDCSWTTKYVVWLPCHGADCHLVMSSCISCDYIHVELFYLHTYLPCLPWWLLNIQCDTTCRETAQI